MNFNELHFIDASRKNFGLWCSIALHLDEAGACGTRNDRCTGQRQQIALRWPATCVTGKEKVGPNELRQQQISALLTLTIPLAVCSAAQMYPGTRYLSNFVRT
jgi:hypothetical protein